MKNNKWEIKSLKLFLFFVVNVIEYEPWHAKNTM